MTTRLYWVINQAAADTSSVPFVASGESENPTGAIIIASLATSIESTHQNAAISIGFTDFTNQHAVAMGAEDNDAVATDTSCRHEPNKCLTLIRPGDTITDRTFTCSAISGGLNLTADGSGDQVQVAVLLIFGTDCIVFNTGDTTANAATFNVAHGMSPLEPKIGFAAFCNENNGGNTQGDLSFGFFTNVTNNIVQRCLAIRMQTAQANGEAHMELANNLISKTNNNSAGTICEQQITAIDTTNVTFTNTGNTMTGNVIGLLLEADDVTTAIVDATAPTSADSTWNVDGASFQPQAGIGLLSQMTTINQQVADSVTSGAFGIWGFDEQGGLASITISDENSVLPTDCRSYFSDELRFTDDDGDVEFILDTITPDADGFSVAAGDITSVNGGSFIWPILLVEQYSATGADAGGSTFNRFSLLTGLL